jgi:NAD/NADP transhydrogenase beta subunit
MKKSELFFASLVLIALVLKLAHLPGSNFILVISLSYLSFLYFYLGFALFNNISLRQIPKRESYKKISTLRIIGAIGAGLALSQTAIGILFTLLRWPGANNLLQIGLIGLVLTGVLGAIKFSQTKATFYPDLLKRVVFSGVFGLILFLVY